MIVLCPLHQMETYLKRHRLEKMFIIFFISEFYHNCVVSTANLVSYELFNQRKGFTRLRQFPESLLLKYCNVTLKEENTKHRVCIQIIKLKSRAESLCSQKYSIFYRITTLLVLIFRRNMASSSSDTVKISTATTNWARHLGFYKVVISELCSMYL